MIINIIIINIKYKNMQTELDITNNIQNLDNLLLADYVTLIKKINTVPDLEKETHIKDLYQKIKDINEKSENFQEKESALVSFLKKYAERLGGVDWAIDDLTNFAGILIFSDNITKRTNHSIGINIVGLTGTAGLVTVPTVIEAVQEYAEDQSNLERIETTTKLAASIFMLGSPTLNFITNFAEGSAKLVLARTAAGLGTGANTLVLATAGTDMYNKFIHTRSNSQLISDLQLTPNEINILGINQGSYIQYIPNVLSILGQGLMFGYNSYNISMDEVDTKSSNITAPHSNSTTNANDESIALDIVPSAIGPLLILTSALLTKTLCKEIEGFKDFDLTKYGKLLPLMQDAQPLKISNELSQMDGYGKATRKYYTQESEKPLLTHIVKHYLPELSNTEIFQEGPLAFTDGINTNDNPLLTAIQSALEEDAKYLQSGYITGRSNEDGNSALRLIKGIILMNSVNRSSQRENPSHIVDIENIQNLDSQNCSSIKSEYPNQSQAKVQKLSHSNKSPVHAK